MSMDLLLQNLSRVAQKYDLIPCGDAFTIKDENIFVHSSRNPLEEASRFIETPNLKNAKSTTYILWGMGLGYHAQLLLDQGFTVIGVEHRPKCVAILRETFPLERLHAFVFGDEIESKIFSAIASLPPEQSLCFVDLIMRNCTPQPSTIELADKAKHAIRSSNLIYSKLMDSWYCHILENLLLPHKLLIKMPLDAFTHKKVLICSAGPSLKESLPHILRLQKQMVIIAVDTAFSALVDYGIIPDFVHAVDAKIHNIGDFADISDEVYQQIVLLADITLSPAVCQKPWKAIEFLCTEQPIDHPQKGLQYQTIALIQYLRTHGLDVFGVQTGGSVATSAFHYALGHGAEQVFLVGQDLAYSNHRGHAVGTPYDKDYRLQTSRLNPIDNIHCHKLPSEGDAILTQGIDEEITIVDPLLNQFRLWFETSVADKENSELFQISVNASEQGAYFKGWKHQKLSSMQYLSEDISPLVSPQYTDSFSSLVEKVYEDLKSISLTSHEQSPLHREFFYLEHISQLTDETVDPALTHRKLKRIQKLLNKIKEVTL
ncbi:MAG: motility associated factor glycosyltransferase family protein [Brevinema sp.]